MIGIVIVAHGGLAPAYKAAMEHVVGALPDVVAISIGDEDGPSGRRDEICAAADAVDTGDGVVLVTDLFGSTPSNLAVSACRAERMDVIYGINLPLLIQLAKLRSEPRAIAVAGALTAGRRYIDVWQAPIRQAV